MCVVNAPITVPDCIKTSFWLCDRPWKRFDSHLTDEPIDTNQI